MARFRRPQPRPALRRRPGRPTGGPITAAHLRELLEQLVAICPGGGLQAPTGGILEVAVTDGGQTSCANLCCLRRRHHRLKTHAAGWVHTRSADGVLTVITPSGVTRVSRPPGWRVLSRAPESPELPPDDPPPF